MKDNRLRSPEEIMEKYKNDPFAFKRGSFKLSLEKIGTSGTPGE